MLKKLRERVFSRTRSSASESGTGFRSRYESESSSSSARSGLLHRTVSDGQIDRINRVSLRLSGEDGARSSLLLRDRSLVAITNYYTVQRFDKSMSDKVSNSPSSSTLDQQTETSVLISNPAALREATRVAPADVPVTTETMTTDPVPMTTDQIAERVRSKSSISRSVPNFLDISKEQDIDSSLYTPTSPASFEDRKYVLEHFKEEQKKLTTLPLERQKRVSLEERESYQSEKTNKPARTKSSVSEKLRRSASTKSKPEEDNTAEAVPEGIPKKKYIGKYIAEQEGELFDDGSIIFNRKPKEKKDWSLQRIFSTSKKNRKLQEKEKDGLKSCIITEGKKQLRRLQREQAGRCQHVRFTAKEHAEDRTFVYTKEHLDLIVERKIAYENLRLDKNWCIAQLHAALSPETHLYQVELEKDNAFGLGFYLYGLGPDTMVPYVSIFVKDVIKGGYVDRQGTIKPHDQIIKCGPASFVGIKQEEALRLMKNKPHLTLTMGRRTKPGNVPLTKQDHKETLSSVGTGWLDPKRSAAAMENGDFRLIKNKELYIDPFFTCNNSSPKKTIQIDTNNLDRINGHKQSVEAEEGTPNLNQILHARQDFLEEELKESDKKLREAERRNQELLAELNALKHQKDFASQEAKYANLKIGELAHENTQLRLDSKRVPATWDNKPDIAAAAVAGDLESLLNHDDTMSVSTIRTVEPMTYCSPGRSGFREMEMLSSEALESSSELTMDGQYVKMQVPTSYDSASRFSYPSSYSNYSSRRQSDQSGQLSVPGSHLSSIVSLNSALSYNSITSDEYDPERTPVNRLLDQRWATVKPVDDGHGEMSQHQMFEDVQDEDDSDEGEDEENFDCDEGGHLRENRVVLV